MPYRSDLVLPAGPEVAEDGPGPRTATGPTSARGMDRPPRTWASPRWPTSAATWPPPAGSSGPGCRCVGSSATPRRWPLARPPPEAWARAFRCGLCVIPWRRRRPGDRRKPRTARSLLVHRRITVRSYGVQPRAGGPVLPLPVRRLRAVASRPAWNNPDLYYRTNLLLAPVTPARPPAAFVEPQADEAGDHADNWYQHQNLPPGRRRDADRRTGW